MFGTFIMLAITLLANVIPQTFAKQHLTQLQEPYAQIFGDFTADPTYDHTQFLYGEVNSTTTNDFLKTTICGQSNHPDKNLTNFVGELTSGYLYSQGYDPSLMKVCTTYVKRRKNNCLSYQYGSLDGSFCYDYYTDAGTITNFYKVDSSGNNVSVANFQIMLSNLDYVSKPSKNLLESKPYTECIDSTHVNVRKQFENNFTVKFVFLENNTLTCENFTLNLYNVCDSNGCYNITEKTSLENYTKKYEDLGLTRPKDNKNIGSVEIKTFKTYTKCLQDEKLATSKQTENVTVIDRYPGRTYTCTTYSDDEITEHYTFCGVNSCEQGINVYNTTNVIKVDNDVVFPNTDIITKTLISQENSTRCQQVSTKTSKNSPDGKTVVQFIETENNWFCADIVTSTYRECVSSDNKDETCYEYPEQDISKTYNLTREQVNKIINTPPVPPPPTTPKFCTKAITWKRVPGKILDQPFCECVSDVKNMTCNQELKWKYLPGKVLPQPVCDCCSPPSPPPPPKKLYCDKAVVTKTDGWKRWQVCDCISNIKNVTCDKTLKYSNNKAYCGC